MKIGEICSLYNISKRTLRYYEEIGLLTSNREERHRVYSKNEIERIERILLLKKTGLQLSEIKILISDVNNNLIQNKLNERLNQVILELTHREEQRKLIVDIINLNKINGMNNINFYELLKEKVYIQEYIKKIEGIDVYMKELIRVEFGEALVENIVENNLVDKVKELKEKIKREMGKNIPLIRIRDDSNITGKEFKIVLKNVVVISKEVENVQNSTHEIIEELERTIINNIESIEARF